MLNQVDCVALDIGGANLKLADGRGFAASRPFPLWTAPGRLASEIAYLLQDTPQARGLAVTMTGELADCFETKVDGVAHIVRSACEAAAGRQVLVYLVTGDLVTPDAALETPQLAAASNWHALATFVGRFLPRCSGDGGPRDREGRFGLLIDVGSTTTDIIPFASDRPLSTSRCDVDRLARGELVYTGVRRTPVCAVVESLPWRDGTCPVAREVFATTADAYVLLRDLPEEPSDQSTADGRPLTREFAHARLARMLCIERDNWSYDAAVSAAAAVRDAQLRNLRAAVDQVLSGLPQPPGTIVTSGEGEFLGRQLVAEWTAKPTVISLKDLLGASASRAAPAHALAVLAREREESRR